MPLHAREIAERAHLEDVVPGAVDERRHLHVGPVLLDVQLLPESVVVRMVDPVIVVLGERGERSEARERQLPDPFGRQVGGGIRVPLRDDLIDLGLWHGKGLQPADDRVGHEGTRRPAQAEPEVEHAVHIGPVVVIIRGGDLRRDGREVRRRQHRGLPLREAQVGPARRPHLAGRPWLGRGPLDRVVAVLGLLHHLPERTLRPVRPAGLLRESHVPVIREWGNAAIDETVEAAAAECAGVWVAQHDDGIAAGRVGEVNIGRE